MTQLTLLADRALIRLSAAGPGEDVRDFLQGLVTQDVRKVLAQAPQYAGLLSAQGKALFDFLLWADGADLLLDCARDAAEGLMRRLTLYRLRRKISIALEPALSVHWSLQAPDGASPDPRLAALGWRWLASTPAADSGSADAAWLAHRLALGVPEGVNELGDILWLETNAGELNGVAFDKGCYVGQENTARMNWRQKINRRLVVVPLADADAKRQRAAYPELGRSVEHRRVEGLAGLDLPAWLAGAISAGDDEAV
ncbi:folate-binding protein YgfZ [Blastomonas sp.]|uniref:CAF17-like 4Fe-4S cluster assembly/insertion protein YgfZ n=1 Tax=Blastomonas sp. TaxID=1909299 RepID=UPI00359446CF